MVKWIASPNLENVCMSPVTAILNRNYHVAVDQIHLIYSIKSLKEFMVLNIVYKTL